MKTSVCKEWHMADAIKGSSQSASHQSHRNVTRYRSRSPEKWRGKTSKYVADIIGPSVNHSATGYHSTHLINPVLEPNNGKATVHIHSVSKQSTRDPRLAASLHTQPIQQKTSMIQQQPAVSLSPSQRVIILKITIDPRDGLPLLFSHSVEGTSYDPATQPVPTMISFPPGLPIHTFRVTTDPSDGHSVILSHTVQVTGHAANSEVDPSNSTEGQPSGSDAKARETYDDNQTKVRMMFEAALKKFVTKQIEETRDAQSTQELCDFVMQKTVEKIMRSKKNFSSAEEEIRKYLSFCKGKIKKLIQDYFHKYNANTLQ